MTDPTPEKVYRAYLEAVVQAVGSSHETNYRGQPVRTRDRPYLRDCYTQFWTGEVDEYCHALLPPDSGRNPSPDYVYREIDTTAFPASRDAAKSVVASGAEGFIQFDRACPQVLPSRPELWLLIQEVLP